MSNRRGSVSFLVPPVPPPRSSIVEEQPEIKGIQSIKVELTTLHDELNKLKASKCKCRCTEVEQRLLKQIDNLSKKLQELVEN
jgi:hypothetical protein